jgi:4-oxalocrotonate tautomerase
MDMANKAPSRRGFLRGGAIALSAVALCEVAGLTSAAQLSGPQRAKEIEMPHIIVKMYPGRSEQQKRQLADAIVKDVVAIAGGSEDSVSVAIEEIAPADWAEKVYKPDIQKSWDRLYKKPNY